MLFLELVGKDLIHRVKLLHLNQFLNVTTRFNNDILQIIVSCLKIIQRLHLLKYLHSKNIELLIKLCFHLLLILKRKHQELLLIHLNFILWILHLAVDRLTFFYNSLHLIQQIKMLNLKKLGICVILQSLTFIFHLLIFIIIPLERH